MFLISVLSILMVSAAPVNEVADSSVIKLQEVTVSDRKAANAIRTDETGTLHLNSVGINDMTQIMGNADPIYAMQSLSVASTNNSIGGGLNVQGCGLAQNHLSINGHQVINPMHMLGIFSVFNTPHFSEFTLAPIAHSGSAPNAIGAIFEARTPTLPPEDMNGDVSIGLIESHGTFTAPFNSGNSSLSLSARTTYIDLLFPHLLTFSHADLKYGFNDFNATFNSVLGSKWRLLVDMYYGNDNMKLDDNLYSSFIDAGWGNLATGVNLLSDKWHHRISYSHVFNKFIVEQNALRTHLPFGLSAINYYGKYENGDFTTSVDAVARTMRQQYNSAINSQPPLLKSIEANASAEYRVKMGKRWSMNMALRVCGYFNGGFHNFYPLPKITIAHHFDNGWNISAHYGHFVQTVHHIQESDVGLPTDFYLIANDRFRPMTAKGASLSLNAPLPYGLAVNIEGYYRRLRNVTEYNGALLNFLYGSYEPLDDVVIGDGYSYGMSLTVSQAIGLFSGWLSYNLGKSRSRFDRFGNNYLPSALDRLHDLNLSMSMKINRSFRLSAMLVYATGTPYTKAAYGYIIGDNLICEYYPHNSSRLPDYKRLDIGAQWVVSDRKGIKQSLQISLFNLLRWHNVLFEYTTYTLDNGIQHKQAHTDYLLPSINYSIKF